MDTPKPLKLAIDEVNELDAPFFGQSVEKHLEWNCPILTRPEEALALSRAPAAH